MTQPFQFNEEVDLPSGGHVSFRNPESLTGKSFRAIVESLGREREADFRMATDATAGIASALIKAWTLPYAPGEPLTPTGDEPWPVPVTPAMLDDLGMRDYRAVLEAVAPAVQMFMPAQPSPDDAGVPGSPTAPVSG